MGHPDPSVHEPAGAGRAQVHAQAWARAAGEVQDASSRALPARAVAGARRLLDWWQGTRAGRAHARFGAAGGGVLTGGIAYAALFSLSAGLTLGWTVFVRVLGANQDLRETVLTTVDQSLPGLLDTGDGQGLLDPDELVMSTGLTVASIVAVVVLLVSATSAMAALRTGVRAMFSASSENAVLGKLRELGGLAGVALVVLVSAALSMLVTGATQRLLGVLGIDDASGALLQLAGIGVAFAVDVAVFVLVVVVLAGLRPARRDLMIGAALAATGLGAVRLLGTTVVAGSVSRNALLGSFALLVTLLVWMNLVARIMLLAAAWVADPPAPATEPASPEAGAPDTHEPVPPRG